MISLIILLCVAQAVWGSTHISTSIEVAAKERIEIVHAINELTTYIERRHHDKSVAYDKEQLMCLEDYLTVDREGIQLLQMIVNASDYDYYFVLVPHWSLDRERVLKSEDLDTAYYLTSIDEFMHLEKINHILREMIDTNKIYVQHTFDDRFHVNANTDVHDAYALISMGIRKGGTKWEDVIIKQVTLL